MTLPTRIHELRGKPVLPEAKPELISTLPDPPEVLSEFAQNEWWRAGDELQRLGLLTCCDLSVFAAYCQAYGRWFEAERKLAQIAKASPTDYLTAPGSQRDCSRVVNPLVRIAAQSADAMVAYAAHLGLTPISRRRIAAAGQQGRNRPTKFDGLIGHG